MVWGEKTVLGEARNYGETTALLLLLGADAREPVFSGSTSGEPRSSLK